MIKEIPARISFAPIFVVLCVSSDLYAALRLRLAPDGVLLVPPFLVPPLLSRKAEALRGPVFSAEELELLCAVFS